MLYDKIFSIIHYGNYVNMSSLDVYDKVETLDYIILTLMGSMWTMFLTLIIIL
jgi:hypothetical protein